MFVPTCWNDDPQNHTFPDRYNQNFFCLSDNPLTWCKFGGKKTKTKPNKNLFSNFMNFLIILRIQIFRINLRILPIFKRIQTNNNEHRFSHTKWYVPTWCTWGEYKFGRNLMIWLANFQRSLQGSEIFNMFVNSKPNPLPINMFAHKVHTRATK